MNKDRTAVKLYLVWARNSKGRWVWLTNFYGGSIRTFTSKKDARRVAKIWRWREEHGIVFAVREVNGKWVKA